LPTFVTIPESDVANMIDRLRYLDESLSNQPIVQEQQDLSLQILDTLKTLTSADEELVKINSPIPFVGTDVEVSFDNSTSHVEPNYDSAPTLDLAESVQDSSLMKCLKPPVAASDSGISFSPTSVDSRSKSSVSSANSASVRVDKDNLSRDARNVTLSLEMQKFKRRTSILETLREVGFKDAEVPPLKLKKPVEVRVIYLRAMEMLGKDYSEDVDVKVGLSDRHRLVSVSLTHDENRVFPHQHKPAYFLSHFTEPKRRDAAMPLHDPKDLLSLVPVSYGLVDAVPASPSSWNVFFVDHFCAITFMENPPKIIAQYPCLRLRLTCHLSLSLASRIRSPLFPISVRASRQRREDSGDSSKSTEALISLALQLDGLDLFYLQRRDEALDGRLLLDKPGTEAVVSAWDLFFSTVHFALRFRTLGRRTFEDVSIELVSLPGRDFYDDKEFLALHL